MDAVFQKTRELGQALMESEPYIKMKEAEDKAMRNEEAARSMGIFLEKRQQLQKLMQSDNPDPGALKRLSNEMDEAQERLQMIDDILALNDARNEFNALISQINQVLQFIVTGDMTQPSNCSGNCQGCSGCH
ncbi:MAG: YlbF family regulator [Clostridia bacterium]|nr:YlbF family regulator [Clostridia bacterium]